MLDRSMYLLFIDVVCKVGKFEMVFDVFSYMWDFGIEI